MMGGVAALGGLQDARAHVNGIKSQLPFCTPSVNGKATEDISCLENRVLLSTTEEDYEGEEEGVICGCYHGLQEGSTRNTKISPCDTSVFHRLSASGWTDDIVEERYNWGCCLSK